MAERLVGVGRRRPGDGVGQLVVGGSTFSVRSALLVHASCHAQVVLVPGHLALAHPERLDGRPGAAAPRPPIASPPPGCPSGTCRRGWGPCRTSRRSRGSSRRTASSPRARDSLGLSALEGGPDHAPSTIRTRRRGGEVRRGWAHVCVCSSKVGAARPRWTRTSRRFDDGRSMPSLADRDGCALLGLGPEPGPTSTAVRVRGNAHEQPFPNRFIHRPRGDRQKAPPARRSRGSPSWTRP